MDLVDWLRAHVAPGMHVLDIATGTGLAAEAALGVIGAAGHVTAADLSPAMVEKARQRLGNVKNVSLAVEDGQALSYPDESFDAVVCSLGLMFFPDPLRALAEFRRVLRPGGRAAISVNTVRDPKSRHLHRAARQASVAPFPRRRHQCPTSAATR